MAIPPHALPLIGREGIVAALREALAGHRLVTLVGEGGTGKTRAAALVAAATREAYPAGFRQVDLSALADPAHVASAFLAGLGLRETPGRAPLESAILWLAPREALLVVDTCEPVAGEAARIVRAIAERCAKVRVLATSRAALGIFGEHTVRMPTLAVPPATPALTAESARRYGAVRLFEDRAIYADPRFRLTDANAPTVGEICRNLDGNPYAIELAAARAHALAPLRPGGVLASSYAELSERDRRVFERLGVFAGDWPLAAAIALCADDEINERDVTAAVHVLAAASFARVATDVENTTYRLPQSARAFALQRLAAGGNDGAMRARHAAYALAVSQQIDADYVRVPSAIWERHASAALADVRAAIAWAFDREHDVVTGIMLIANMRWYWNALAPWEGMALVRRARDLCTEVDLPATVRGKLAIAEAVLATGLGDYRRQRGAAERARGHWAAAGDELERAIADRTYAQALLFLGDEGEGLPILEDAVAVLRTHGCVPFASLALDTLGVHHFARGDIVTARGCLTEAIALARAGGYERGLPFFNVNLAEIEALSGNVEAAIALCRESLERTSAKNELYTFALAWSNLAMYYARLDRWDEALAAATAGFNYACDAGVPSFAAFSLQTIAAVRVFRGDAHDGARLAGYVDARIAEIGFERGATENTQYQRMLERARAIVGRGDVDAELARGHALSAEAALQLAGVTGYGDSP